MRFFNLLIFSVVLYAASISTQKIAAQEVPYTEGTVWTFTFMRIKPGMLNAYLREVAPQRKAYVDEAKKQGLILSSRILYGDSVSKDDWDLVIVNEYKNWAAFDGLSEKFNALLNKFGSSEQDRIQLTTKRGEMRDFIGTKTMQELILK